MRTWAVAVSIPETAKSITSNTSPRLSRSSLPPDMAPQTGILPLTEIEQRGRVCRRTADQGRNRPSTAAHATMKTAIQYRTVGGTETKETSETVATVETCDMTRQRRCLEQ